MTNSPRTTLFLGGGNMARAILRGYRASGGDMQKVFILDPFLPQDAADELGAGGLFRSAADFPRSAEFGQVVLATKPQVFDEAAAAARAAFEGAPLIISIMAGVSSTRISQATVSAAPVVRCMPNMAAAAGCSVNVAFCADEPSRAAFEALFRGSGPVYWVDAEEDIHATTAVSGSGPAYFFAFAEALQLAGQKAGLNSGFALDLAIDTLIGSAELLKQQRDPAAFRRSITSKGGTTEAALAAFALHNNLNAIVEDAVLAAAERSKAL
jgi:pyrroline-5-carboxylate reductase